MSTYTGSELATKYAAYLIYKGTATPTEINQMTSPKLGYVFDVTANGTITNGNIQVVAGDAIVYLAQGWTHMNNGSADQQIATLSAQVTQLINLIGDTNFSRFALKTEIPTVPTKVSAFQNDSGYLTQHQSLAAYQTKANSDAAYVGKLSSLDTTAADGTIVQYIGTTTAVYRKGYFYIYHTGTGWENIRVSESSEGGIKQATTLGTGTEGEIVFYTGTTTEDYITNNFYKYTNGEWAWVDLPSLTFAYNSTTKTLSIEYGEAAKEVNINNIIKDNTDDELNNTSENPIQNKVVAEALSDIEEVTDKLTADLSGLHMEFDANNLQLVLLDSDDQVIGTANLSTLAKDAMLEDVEIFTEAESGVSVSTPYLKFTFNTDAGTQPIRVPLTEFVINVTTDTELSPISTNPVQNKVIYAALQALQEAINNATAVPDAALSTTSSKPVQNRIITNELNGVKDRVAALEGSGVNYKYFKQVENLDTYQAEDGEIVEYIGATNSKYTHGLTYKFIQGETVEVPRGYYYINLDNNHILVSSGETATGITQYMNVINKNGSYYTFFCKQSLSGNTPTDWNAIVQQELVNKLLVMKSDSGVKSWIKVVSITGEQISDYTWKFSTLTLEDGMVINREDITATSGSVASDILIDLNDSNSPDYYAIPDTPPIVSPTVINGCLFPTMQCGVGFNGSQKWASSEIEIDFSEWRHIKTTDTSTIESNIAALQTSKANEVTSFTEAATRANIASGDRVTTIWGKIKKIFTDLKAVAFSGSYNDLSEKPLSVESSKVKYTLSDGTTKLTLAQENDIKDIGIDFTSSAVSGNIVSGETLAVMMKKIFQKQRFLSCELPYLQFPDLPSQSTNTETACKEWLQYIVTNHWNKIEDQILYVAPFRPNSSGFVVGYFYATDTPNAQHFPSYCSFLFLGISTSTLFNKFGTINYTFYFKSLTI